MKIQLNEIKRMQHLAGLITESEYQNSLMNETYPSRVWNWNISEFGKYNSKTKIFTMNMDGDAYADYMDTEFPNWLKNEKIADKGTKKYREDIKNAVEEEYGPGITINGYDFNESKYQNSLMNETMYYVHDEEGMEEPIGPFTMDQAKQELAKHGIGWKLIDAETAKQIWSYLEDDKPYDSINENIEDELQLTPKLKLFIDKSIKDTKRDGDFEYLISVDYYENDFIDFILIEFDEESEYDTVSKEVKEYIDNAIK